MTVELQSYIQPATSRISAPTNISNIVATLRGSSDPDRIYVVRYGLFCSCVEIVLSCLGLIHSSGHYDSRNTDVMNYIDDAPGADDE